MTWEGQQRWPGISRFRHQETISATASEMDSMNATDQPRFPTISHDCGSDLHPI